MATILPTGETTFFDANGNPLAGGTVTFYIPSTTTPKDTWMDAAQSILNSNPVILDGAGRAIIFGSGSYRQVVADADGNLIWDRTTAEPNAGNSSSGGTSGGTANAQTLTAGTFDGSDGSTITFVAGVTNTGAMTLSVGGGAPIAVLKNGPTGPVDLAAGDITSGNIYSVAYSATNASFQLLQSIPPVFAIASQASAEAGTNNTDLMTPLRVKQAREQARVDVASAATTDIGAVSSQSIRITGTSTITSFGTGAAGIRKTLTFASALTLTRNATSMILPNSTRNIVTTAGDTCEALSLGSGNWIVTNYQFANPASAFGSTGTAPVFAARAWVNFDGTGTPSIRASGNVSSITDLGTGRYRVNLATAVPSNCAIVASATQDASVESVAYAPCVSDVTTTSFRVTTSASGSSSPSPTNNELISAVVFG